MLAREFADKEGGKYVDAQADVLADALVSYALPRNIQGLKDDMAKYRVLYDVWFSETTLHPDAISDVLEKLAQRCLLYTSFFISSRSGLFFLFFLVL